MGDQNQRQSPSTPPQVAAAAGQRPSGPPRPADALAREALPPANLPAADVWGRAAHEPHHPYQPHASHDPHDPADVEDFAREESFGAFAANAISPEMRLRVQARQQLREFLRSVPRTEAEATVAIVRLDGSTRVLTRGQITTAIDQMRPRMRQIIRLAVEERWSRTRVCAYLQHISLKTLERDYVEAMDYLAQEL